ncbi:ring finger domain containing protein [Nitzschia inconspicua]|uniref:Ring finger domain containing protein n=1 Tax=Nitzschia inconspicua TaxID=303405 RepID=A0A9K3LEM6_9STRA|nr:ring finger domain containing protein [Nitzschia inconspicua]
MNAPTRSSRSAQMEEQDQISTRLFTGEKSPEAVARRPNVFSTPPRDQTEEQRDDAREESLLENANEERAHRCPPSVPAGEHFEEISAEEQARRDEEASLELARALQAEEAMASYTAAYQVSMEYLRNHQNEFSQEELAALQAAVEEENNANQGDEIEANAADVSDLSYDMLLRLGNQMGDVKLERWAMVAQQKIDALPLVIFDPESVNESKSNDCDIKCLVCHEQYEKGNSLRCLPCGHLFHAMCVDQWLHCSDKCPFCRTSLNNE